MIIAQIMERKVQCWSQTNSTGRALTFLGIITGEPSEITIVGKRYVVTVSHDGHCSGALWADVIQRGEANDVPVS